MLCVLVDIAEFNIANVTSSSAAAAAAAAAGNELLMSVRRRGSIVIPCLPDVPLSLPSPALISYLHNDRPLTLTGTYLYLPVSVSSPMRSKIFIPAPKNMAGKNLNFTLDF